MRRDFFYAAVYMFAVPLISSLSCHRVAFFTWPIRGGGGSLFRLTFGTVRYSVVQCLP